MEHRGATLDLLLAALSDLTGSDEGSLARLQDLLKLPADGRPAAARQRTRRLDLCWRLLQDIPLDERSFDNRLGLAGRRATIAHLEAWCLGHRDPNGGRPAGPGELFGSSACSC
ncbi:hypothetical protein [Streptomyces sp. E-08]|uniref:hypothetical protein n=1 Tax=Streptomyces sp. E-08 TaxID=3404047 RepID=UPI003CF4CAA0